jgi:hypothetical protein
VLAGYWSCLRSFRGKIGAARSPRYFGPLGYD